MPNFLSETEEAIRKAGYSPDRIRRIGSWRTRENTPWPEFRKSADFDYDPEADPPVIPHDLAIEFDDGSALRRDSIEFYDYWNHWRADELTSR